MGTSLVTWEEAIRGFVTHKKAVKAATTALWYLRYSTQLMKWAEAQNLSLGDFTKRSLLLYACQQTSGRLDT